MSSLDAAAEIAVPARNTNAEFIIVGELPGDEWMRQKNVQRSAGVDTAAVINTHTTGDTITRLISLKLSHYGHQCNLSLA